MMFTDGKITETSVIKWNIEKHDFEI